MKRLAILLMSSVLLAACAAPAPPSGGTAGPRGGGQAGPAASEPVTSSVVARLLVQARQAERVGDLSATEANLERALRIEPRNARLWHYMARLRMAQKAYPEAASLAAKSNSLAQGNRALHHDNWRLISQALTLQGDSEAAAAAAARAAAFKE